MVFHLWIIKRKKAAAVTNETNKNSHIRCIGLQQNKNKNKNTSLTIFVYFLKRPKNTTKIGKCVKMYPMLNLKFT